MEKSKETVTVSVAYVDTPTHARPGALNTLSRVRSELAQVYRDARTGRIATAQATRLAYILSVLSRLIERSDLERRLEELEQTLENRNG